MHTTRTDVGTVEDLHASATRLTGLDDFGDDDYLDGLRVLLASYATESAFTPAGSRATRAMVRTALVSRLLSEAAWRQHPEHASVAVTRPIFVTGLPRTGTTALHRLLAADPAHQGLELWLAEAPQPRPPRQDWESHPVYSALQAGFGRHHESDPEFMGMHYTAADQVEECWRLLCQSMRSVSFECLAHIPAYSGWLATQDWTSAYRRHRRNLQLIGLPDRDRRWVLKNPSHLFALDALLAAYPDAVVIQTHRAPRTAIASVCSLNARAARGWSERFGGETVGRGQLALWSRGVRRFLADRERHAPEHFIDVGYDDFVADPIGIVAAIYDRLGRPLSPQARTAMLALHARSRSGLARPAHRYELADFGLTAAEVDEAFGDYLATYPGVSPSGR
ncbi:sulfotransferase family protein [Couchioplanes caeruleus]|uniref:Sulfotransferase n=2 Tax=Couchioplanes caeruleus TaxID=56438 RepID=A0A1K0FQT6_9ACTN|nr:sulfotransferase [Couchioplanes caeruleus]OJF15189.1 sulfotransferase [Couchioplanes caeruleus subsp. caeruleus]ROP28031.1 sulfotransferase family protein [Couchioplanes caeruleus]